MKLKEKEDQRVETSWKGNKILMGRDTETKKGLPETSLPGNTSHIQLTNQDTILDANKCLLTGP